MWFLSSSKCLVESQVKWTLLASGHDDRDSKCTIKDVQVGLVSLVEVRPVRRNKGQS